MINAVMITMDRAPQDNYLSRTLDNLGRAGVFDSPQLERFDLVDSGGSNGWLDAHTRDAIRPHTTADGEHRCANLNVAAALRIAAESAPDWALFLEDDIDVCSRFVESVAAWLQRHGNEDHILYPLGASYVEVGAAVERGEDAWQYPIGNFYGTQAVAMRPDAALRIAAYLEEHTYDHTDDGTAYDLAMARWHREAYPDIEFLLTPAPSFVQHIGASSVIRPRRGVHTFMSWPGTEWSYPPAAGGAA